MYEELYHHGVKGQKWGVRRYQNYDGTWKNSSGKSKKMSTEEAKQYARRKKLEYIGKSGSYDKGYTNSNGTKGHMTSYKTVKKYVNSDGTLNKKGQKKMDKSLKYLTKREEKYFIKNAPSRKQRKETKKLFDSYKEKGEISDAGNNKMYKSMYKSKDVRLIDHANDTKYQEKAQKRLNRTMAIGGTLLIGSVAASGYTSYKVIRSML